MRNWLRDAVTALRERESALPVVFLAGGWALCPGCDQSCTGSYDGHQCCTRCRKVVT